MHKAINETGNRYGRLIVIERTDIGTKGHARWKCLCDCGNEAVVLGHSLRRGVTQSCGCLRRERMREIHILPKGEAAFNDLFSSIKRRAKHLNRVFDLTKEQVKYLTSQPCYYCGAKPAQFGTKLENTRNRNGAYIYNGLDRVNNEEGYVLENIVPCCGICNHAKSTMTQDEFLGWVSRIYQRKHSHPDIKPQSPKGGTV